MNNPGYGVSPTNPGAYQVNWDLKRVGKGLLFMVIAMLTFAIPYLGIVSLILLILGVFYIFTGKSAYTGSYQNMAKLGVILFILSIIVSSIVAALEISNILVAVSSTPTTHPPATWAFYVKMYDPILFFNGFAIVLLAGTLFTITLGAPSTVSKKLVIWIGFILSSILAMLIGPMSMNSINALYYLPLNSSTLITATNTVINITDWLLGLNALIGIIWFIILIIVYMDVRKRTVLRFTGYPPGAVPSQYPPTQPYPPSQPYYQRMPQAPQQQVPPGAVPSQYPPTQPYPPSQPYYQRIPQAPQQQVLPGAVPSQYSPAQPFGPDEQILYVKAGIGLNKLDNSLAVKKIGMPAVMGTLIITNKRLIYLSAGSGAAVAGAIISMTIFSPTASGVMKSLSSISPEEYEQKIHNRGSFEVNRSNIANITFSKASIFKAGKIIFLLSAPIVFSSSSVVLASSSLKNDDINILYNIFNPSGETYHL